MNRDLGRPIFSLTVTCGHQIIGQVLKSYSLKTVACGHRIIDQALGSYSSKTVACGHSRTGVGNDENHLIILNRT